MSDIIALENGLKVQWNKRSAFGKYELNVLKWPEMPEGVNCYNPWNWMSPEESKLVKSYQPTRSRDVCDLDCLLTNKVIKKEDLANEMSEIIGADCWGVFVTNSRRTDIIKVYFDTREDQHFNNQSTRNKLIEDPTELIDYVKDGDTVVIVMGGDKFYEFYFEKLGDIILLSEVNHTLKW